MNITELHNKAMEYADMAFISKFQDEHKKAKDFFIEAFNYEKEAAYLCLKEKVGEPTQSVLFRSAASLAFNCDLFREAEKLISNALIYDPPFEIAEELRNLLEEINFQRHLELNNIILDESELQLVISGKSIGYGLAKSDEVFNRLNFFKQLAYRTIERKLGNPFREKGALSNKLKDSFQPYISIPRAASFAFTIRIGSPTDTEEIPGMSKSAEYIDDIVDNVRLLNESKEEELMLKINNEAYYRNFISLSREIAPDGKNVNLVGLTIVRNKKEIKTQFTRTKEQISIISPIIKEDSTEKIENISQFSGTLTYADSEKNNIRITEENGNKPMIIVPEGLGDIVRNYFEESVIVKCLSMNGTHKLIELDKCE